MTVDASWPGVAPQPLSRTIAPGRTAEVDFALTSDRTFCATSPVPRRDPRGEAILDATFALAPTSGRERAVRLPIAAWEGVDQSLELFPLANPDDPPSTRTC